MSITARVRSTSNLKSTVGEQKNLRLRSAITSREINKLDDIDVGNLEDGSVLIYSTSSSKWEASTTLDKQSVEGGYY